MSLLVMSVMLISVFSVATTMAKPGKGHGGPVDKVTGEIWFGISQDRTAYARFNAHDIGVAGEDMGNLYFEIPLQELYYEISVYSVNIDGDNAYIAGQVYDSNIFDDGTWVYIYLKDGGTPGANGDKWRATTGSSNTVFYWVDVGYEFSASTLSDVIDGNLVTHTYD